MRLPCHTLIPTPHDTRSSPHCRHTRSTSYTAQLACANRTLHGVHGPRTRSPLTASHSSRGADTQRSPHTSLRATPTPSRPPYARVLAPNLRGLPRKIPCWFPCSSSCRLTSEQDSGKIRSDIGFEGSPRSANFGGPSCVYVTRCGRVRQPTAALACPACRTTGVVVGLVERGQQVRPLLWRQVEVFANHIGRIERKGLIVADDATVRALERNPRAGA